jgi:hypothetical protein
MKKLSLMFLVLFCLGLITMEAFHFTGDGFYIPDAFGLSRHGPASHYNDNGDGTFTDKVTNFMWEIKTDDDSIHDVDNTYTWTKGDDTDPDGTLLEDFLKALNSTCDGKGVTDCKSSKDCVKDEKCGFAGHRDWCIPDVKQLQSIVDYGTFRPASSVHGETATTYYWTATASVINTNNAWIVNFFYGFVINRSKKIESLHARAVRPCQ